MGQKSSTRRKRSYSVGDVAVEDSERSLKKRGRSERRTKRWRRKRRRERAEGGSRKFFTRSLDEATLTSVSE